MSLDDLDRLLSAAVIVALARARYAAVLEEPGDDSEKRWLFGGKKESALVNRQRPVSVGGIHNDEPEGLITRPGKQPAHWLWEAALGRR